LGRAASDSETKRAADLPACEATQAPRTTLGDVLYAGAGASVPEQAWVALIASIAEGDQRALHTLYEGAHPLVFTLLMRLTGSRETAEALTIDVFHDIWRDAARYDLASGTVLGWIMNQARWRAIDRLGRASRTEASGGVGLREPVPADAPRDVPGPSAGDDTLRQALAVLTAEERQAIEATFFAGLTYAEAAARLKQPLGTIKTRIRSGLYKLRHALGLDEVEKR